MAKADQKLLSDEIFSLREQFAALMNYYYASEHTMTDGMKLAFLKKVDAVEKQVYSLYKNNPEMNPDNLDSHMGDQLKQFMVAYFQDSVSVALAKVKDIPLNISNINKREIFNADSVAELPKITDWQRSTTPKKTLFSSNKLEKRSQEYKDVDVLLVEINKAKFEHEEPKVAQQNTVKAVKNLQDYLFKVLTSARIETKPLMKERCLMLLEKTHGYLNSLIKSDPSLDDSYEIPTRLIANPIIDFTTMSTDELNDMAFALAATTSSFSLNGFKIDYLGGNNNKNWTAVNSETGETYVVRCEKSDDPPTDYLLVEEIKNNPNLSKFVAKDSCFYPIGEIELAKDYARPFNIAVSEYCSRGDLSSYINKKNKADPDDMITRTQDVITVTQQVASLGNALQKDDKAYMDIKAENFLIRDDGTVITADIKSVVRANKEGMVPSFLVATTLPYAPPEFKKPGKTYNAEKFMVYQTGLMMYLLLTGYKGKDKAEVLERVMSNTPLDFSHPIFEKTDQGQDLKQLIDAAMSTDPEDRPSMDEFIGACNTLTDELENSSTHSVSMS